MTSFDPTPEIQLSAEDRADFERLGREFLVDFLEVERSMRPENIDALFELGHTYTALGRYHEGLEVDLRLAELMPDNATVHYNLACSQSLLERTDDALESLERAVGLGFDALSLLLNDADLANVRGTHRFGALVGLLGGAE